MMKTSTNQEDSNDNREKERDRRGRGGRTSRFSDNESSNDNGGGGNRDRSRERRNCRIYISNIPYDYRWQDLKDLLRRIVGSVEYVELFHDESGKSRGCGIVEFKDPDNVQVAMEKMNRYEVGGRELVVKEDHGVQRDQYGRIVRDGGGGGGGGGSSRRDDDRGGSGRNNFNMPMSNDFSSSGSHNLYGLSASFLEALGITGPLHNKVFVANLDYKVDSKKLKQVFKLAGKVQSVDLSTDKDGNSRGFAVIEYDHPVEAVQAISMLDRQLLYDRRMTVRLDRIPDKGESLKLPEGLGGIGLGLGPNGEPLKDVAHNLPSIVNQSNTQQQQHQQQQQQPSQQSMNNIMAANSAMGGVGVGGVGNNALFNNPVMHAAAAAVVPSAQNVANKQQANLLGSLSNLSNTNLAALSNVVGGLGAALSNPLLTSSLNNLGLNLGGGGGGQGGMGGAGGGNNDDSMQQANVGLSNNYTSGNNYSSGYGSGSGGYNSNMGGNAGGSGGGGNTGGVGLNSGVGVGLNSGLGGGGGVGVGSGAGVVGPVVNLDNDYKPNIDQLFNSNVGGGGGNVGNAGNLAVASSRKSDTIIIKNLPLSCTWQTLRDKFRDVGEVKFAEIRGNDVGVVRFFKERDAELAIAIMDGSRLDGRTIKVNYF